MKKILLTFLVIILFINTSQVVNACEIDDGAPESLENYIKDIRKVVKNVKKEIASNGKKSSINAIHSELLRSYNSIITWSAYDIEFQFYLYEPIFNEVARQIIRDDKALGREIKKLDKYLGSLAKTGYYQTKISYVDACSGLSNNACEINKFGLENGKEEKLKAGDIIIKTIDDIKKIRKLLQMTVVRRDGEFKKDKEQILLADNNVINDIKSKYNQHATKECSDFNKQIDKKIKQIDKNFKNSSKGIEEWEKAWALLIGTDPKYHDKEKEILKKELSRQGVASDQAEAMMKNLDTFNQRGFYSLQNNFIANTFNESVNSLSGQLNEFEESIFEGFGEGHRNKITIGNLMSSSDKIDNTESIRVEIMKLYNKQINLSQTQDLSTKRILNKIINMHNDLNSSINLLEKTIKISQKVCDDQATGEGKCIYE